MSIRNRHIAVVCIISIATPLHAHAGYENNEKLGLPEGADHGHETYIPVVSDEDFATIMKKDVAAKKNVMQTQQRLLEKRYDLSSRPSNVLMSGGRKPVQERACAYAFRKA